MYNFKSQCISELFRGTSLEYFLFLQLYTSLQQNEVSNFIHQFLCRDWLYSVDRLLLATRNQSDAVCETLLRVLTNNRKDAESQPKYYIFKIILLLAIRCKKSTNR